MYQCQPLKFNSASAHKRMPIPAKTKGMPTARVPYIRECLLQLQAVLKVTCVHAM